MPQYFKPALKDLIFQSGFIPSTVKSWLKKNHLDPNKAGVKRAIKALIKRKGNRKEMPGRDVSFSSPRTEWQIVFGRVRVGGAITFVNVSADNTQLQMVFTLAANRISEIEAVYIEDQLVNFGTTFTSNGQSATSTNFKQKVFAQANLGNHSSALSQLISDSGGKWTSNHKQSGCAHIYIRLEYDKELWDDGPPEFEFLVKGYCDAYTGKDSAADRAAGFTQNPGHILAHLTANTEYGLSREMPLNAFYFDQAILVSDENIPLAAGGTEKRYTCNGVWTSSESRRSMIEDILSSMAGIMVNQKESYGGGGVEAYAAQYITPQFTITEDDVIGSVNISRLNERRDFFDAVRATYVNPSTFQEDQAPTLKSPIGYFKFGVAYSSFIEDISLPCTFSRTTAQRLQKIFMYRELIYPLRISLLVRMIFLKLSPPDHVYVTLSRFNWNAKVFEVESVAPIQANDSNGSPYIAVQLSLRETDPSIYNWSPSEESTPATITSTLNLPTPGVSESSKPSGISATSGNSTHLVNGDGSVLYRILMQWSIPVDAYVSEVEVEFKKTTESIYVLATRVDRAITNTYIVGVQANTAYNIRLRSKLVDGRYSEYATLAPHTVQPKTSAPGNVSDFVGVVSGGDIAFTWAQVSDADIAYYKIKKTSTGQSWAESTDVGNFTGGSATVTYDAAATYKIKAVNTSGQESVIERDHVIATTPVTGNPIGLLLSITYS